MSSQINSSIFDISYRMCYDLYRKCDSLPIYHTFTMKKQKTITFLVSLGVILLSTISINTYAGSNCQSLYGGGQTCPTENKLVLDKKVLNPKSNTTKGGVIAEEFVDNLNINDPKYKAGQTIRFQLNITNIGKTTLQNILIEDTLPENIIFTPTEGNYDSNSHKYTQTIPQLNADETKTIIITGTIAEDKNLPQDLGVICSVNNATAQTTNNYTDDSAGYCIERNPQPERTVYQVPNIKSTPKTGPELLALIGLIPSGIGGILLRKKSLNKVA